MEWLDGFLVHICMPFSESRRLCLYSHSPIHGNFLWFVLWVEAEYTVVPDCISQIGQYEDLITLWVSMEVGQLPSRGLVAGGFNIEWHRPTVSRMHSSHHRYCVSMCMSAKPHRLCQTENSASEVRWQHIALTQLLSRRPRQIVSVPHEFFCPIYPDWPFAHIPPLPRQQTLLPFVLSLHQPPTQSSSSFHSCSAPRSAPRLSKELISNCNNGFQRCVIRPVYGPQGCKSQLCSAAYATVIYPRTTVTDWTARTDAREVSPGDRP